MNRLKEREKKWEKKGKKFETDHQSQKLTGKNDTNPSNSPIAMETPFVQTNTLQEVETHLFSFPVPKLRLIFNSLTLHDRHLLLIFCQDCLFFTLNTQICELMLQPGLTADPGSVLLGDSDLRMSQVTDC